jgi:phospholipase C
MRSDLTRCNQHVVDASQLAADIQNNVLPTYSFYTPNRQNDGHDSSVTFAGKWFANNIEPLFGNPNFMSGTLVIVTFDEGKRSNQIYTALYGSMIVPGSSSNNRYNHYNMLKTVEDNFALGDLSQNDASTEAFADIWNSGDLRSQSNPASPR